MSRKWRSRWLLLLLLVREGHKEKGRCRDSVGEADDDNSVQRSYECLSLSCFTLCFFLFCRLQKLKKKRRRNVCVRPHPANGGFKNSFCNFGEAEHAITPQHPQRKKAGRNITQELSLFIRRFSHYKQLPV